MEVPQLVELEGTFQLLFSAQDGVHSAERIAQSGSAAPTGTFAVSGSSRLGPFDVRTAWPLCPDCTPSLFSGKLIEDAAGNWFFLAFVLEDAAGEFVGELSDPIPVTVHDGKPVLASRPRPETPSGRA
jgi:beta-fructofuranosidase